MSVFSNLAFDHHEKVAFGADKQSGLRAIIAVHDTRLGPGVGGCRMYPYASDDEALYDVLRLSRGMTYKSALAGLPLGGGKSVIIGNPHSDKTPALLHAMGDFINSLGGLYVAAEDSGTGVADIRTMGERTVHVSGLQEGTEHGGDPSPTTAYGVYLGIRTAVQYRLGADSMRGLRVAIQGLGNVGYHLAGRLVADGAIVYGADVNAANLERAREHHGVQVVSTEDILTLEADVFAPCAMGAVLNRDTVNGLRVGIVAGAANNQLADEEQADHLWDRGILYCPDFLINAGGIIDVFHQRNGSDPAVMREHVERIESNLQEILFRSDRAGRSPHLVAEDLAEEYLAAAGSQEPSRIAAF
ncbi:MAG: Glu/Leu/Phe/Val dehydrogenase dimerization domain-containing protein [Halieaceae bacterium]|jgi:leucine dehydrogenase|nr:Glu/Leu/Phe/Val dehydrogenase dimerization domain-containing protein [Halieaceae bacterium]